MQHLLVPYDFNETARHALTTAVDLCRRLGGRITLLYVAHTEMVAETLMGLDAIQYLPRTLDAAPTPDAYAPSFEIDKIVAAAREKLQGCIEPDWSELSFELAVEEGRPADAIVEYAGQHDVDLIVMGTHGRGTVAHFFLGSVAENVVRSAPCPVMTVRSDGR